MAQVDMNLCLLGEDRECSACMRWCPYNAIRYVFSEAEYILVPVIDAGKCNGCGACDRVCLQRIPVSRLEKVTRVDCTNCLDCMTKCKVPGAMDMGV